jgi:NADH:ubiquinone oxidoreductase subunit
MFAGPGWFQRNRTGPMQEALRYFEADKRQQRQRRAVIYNQPSASTSDDSSSKCRLLL